MGTSDSSLRSTWLASLTPAVAVDHAADMESGRDNPRIHTYNVKTAANATRKFQRVVAAQDMVTAASADPVVQLSGMTGAGTVFARQDLPGPELAVPQAKLIADPEAGSVLDDGGFVVPQPGTVPNPGAHTRPLEGAPPNPAPVTPDVVLGPDTTDSPTIRPGQAQPVNDPTSAPAKDQPSTIPPTNPDPTNPLIQQILGVAGPVQQTDPGVGSLPWLMEEVNRPKPEPAPPNNSEATVVDATASVEVPLSGQPQPNAPVATVPNQAELDASRVEQILPEGVPLPVRSGAPTEWVDGNGTQASLSIDEYGQRYWRYLQANGVLIEVTQGGGSDGRDRPWTHTKITEANQRTPRVDTYDTTGITAYVETIDGVDTRYLRFQGGDFGIEAHHGGDQPWTQTIQDTAHGPYITTRTQNGTSWQSPTLSNTIHTRYMGNDGTEAQQTIPLNPWEPGTGYATLPGGVTQHFTTRDGRITGGRYTDGAGTDLGSFQVVNGLTAFFASPENIEKNWSKEGISSLRVEIGPDGKAKTYYRVVNVADEQLRDGQPGDLPGWIVAEAPRKGPAFAGLRRSIGILGDVVGERLAGPFISLSHPVATSQGLAFAPYKPPPEKQHTPGEVLWAAIDVVTVASLFLPLPIAPLLTRAALVGRTAATTSAAIGRTVITGAETFGRTVLASAENASRYYVMGLGEIATASRASMAWLAKTFGSGLPQLSHFGELAQTIKATASTIKDQAAISRNVSAHIAAREEKFRLTYSNTEMLDVIWNRKRLGLDNVTIESLIKTASRMQKPITSRGLIEQMKNWVNVIQPRGYPYRFASTEEFQGFNAALLDNVRKAGLPADQVFVQGSSLRKVAAADVDLAVFVSNDQFYGLLTGFFRGKVASAAGVTPRTVVQLEGLSHAELVQLARHIEANLGLYNAEAKTFKNAVLNGTISSKSKVHKPLKAAAKAMQTSHPEQNVETISILIRHGEFDTLPAMLVK